jgi:methionine synthase I (cobalamin-dependent)
MDANKQVDFDRRLTHVQVWPCSLWRDEWSRRFDVHEMGCGELLSLEHKPTIDAEYVSLARAGTDAFVTNTFGANAIVMESYGEQSKVAVSNRESARIAIEVSDRVTRVPDGPLAVGSIGPTTCLLSTLPSQRDFLKSVYKEQIEALCDAGIGTFHIERFEDPENVYCALEALDEVELERNTAAAPLLRIVTIRVEDEGTMLFETNLKRLWQTLKQFRPKAFGLVGKREGVERCLREISDFVDIPLIAMIDIRALNIPEMPMLHSQQSFASCLVDLTTKFNLKIVGTGVESHPDFVLSLHQLLISSGLREIH